ncbi:MAG: MarR family transcriptional regulator [Chloroflexota bacterium]
MTDNLITDTTGLPVRLWLRLLTSTHMIEGEIRSKLRTTYDTTLPRFDVLAQLYRCPDGLRMGELSKLLMVTGGNITGIIDQLTQEGLVERATDPADRRAYIVRLTEKGSAEFEEMAASHREWIDDLLCGLGTEDQLALHNLLKTLRTSLEEKLNHDSE